MLASFITPGHINDTPLLHAPPKPYAKPEVTRMSFPIMKGLAAILHGSPEADTDEAAILSPRELLVNAILKSSPEEKHSLMAEVERLVRPGCIVAMFEEMETSTVRQLEASLLQKLTESVLDLEKMGRPSRTAEDHPAGTPRPHGSEDRDCRVVLMRELLESTTARHPPYQGSISEIIQTLRCPVLPEIIADRRYSETLQCLTVLPFIASVLSLPIEPLIESLDQPKILCKLVALAVDESILHETTTSVVLTIRLLTEALDVECSRAPPQPRLRLIVAITYLLEYYIDTHHDDGADDHSHVYRAVSKLILNISKVERSQRKTTGWLLPRLVSQKIIGFLVEAVAREGLERCQLPCRTLGFLLSRYESMRYPVMELMQRAMMSHNSRLGPSVARLVLEERENDTQLMVLESRLSEYFKEPTEVMCMRRAHIIDRKTTAAAPVTVTVTRRRGILIMDGPRILPAAEGMEYSRCLQPFTSVTGVMVFHRAPQLMAIVGVTRGITRLQPDTSDIGALPADDDVKLLLFHDDTSATEVARFIREGCSHRFAILAEDSLRRSAARCLHLKPQDHVQLITLTPSGGELCPDVDYRQELLQVCALSSTGKIGQLRLVRDSLLSWPLEETWMLASMRRHSHTQASKREGEADITIPSHPVKNLFDLLGEVDLTELLEIKFGQDTDTGLELVGKANAKTITFTSTILRQRWLGLLAPIIGKSSD
ncbi:hypothetical protein FOZ63_006034 [Perkinsus olseni]|uniref:Uncharacterized protein n=1 Tax=Perkinsus olseni TaxID=32597 RepID=A0A7J6TFX3_PEROL|nr:hypothetical protein FOZ63_006034 [Perkinsus olseni]